MTTTRVTLRCACGSDQFNRPDNPQPHDVISCAGCGATSTYGALIESGKKQILDKVTSDLRKAFKNFK